MRVRPASAGLRRGKVRRLARGPLGLRMIRLLAGRPAVWAGWNSPATIGLIKHPIIPRRNIEEKGNQGRFTAPE